MGAVTPSQRKIQRKLCDSLFEEPVRIPSCAWRIAMLCWAETRMEGQICVEAGLHPAESKGRAVPVTKLLSVSSGPPFHTQP